MMEHDVEALVTRMSKVLASHPPQIQGAVLADLLAIWLAGHFVRGDPEETAKLRAILLSIHLDAVHKLVEVNAEQHIDAE
jgi:hypothetical protein